MNIIIVTIMASLGAYIDYLLKLDAANKSFEHLPLATIYYLIGTIIWTNALTVR